MPLIFFCLCLYKIQETDEARKKFSNAKSISSSQFFGDQSKADVDAQATLSKFSVCIFSFSNSLERSISMNAYVDCRCSIPCIDTVEWIHS